MQVSRIMVGMGCFAKNVRIRTPNKDFSPKRVATVTNTFMALATTPSDPG